MSILTANQLSKVFGADEIFSGISVDIPHGARIALVGPNGAGKTTLIHILLGMEAPTTGSVAVARAARLSYLPQRPELAGQHSLWEEQLRAFAGLRSIEQRLEALAHELHDAAKLETYGHLQAEFEHQGGYTYEARIKQVLSGLGFDADDYARPLHLFSGGQKTRALLGRLLLEAPDLLVLDEPTNHLDIKTVEWLEDYLQGYGGAVLAISHDRYFIDHFARAVWELDFGRLEAYKGDYTHYMRQREERRERLQKDYEAQQEFLSKEMDYIRRNMAGQNTAQAKGRLRRLETMAKRGKLIERGPQDRRKMKLQMATANRSGDKVLTTKALSVGYADDPAPLFRVPDITLYRGEMAALIGPNGAGKSTLLKTLIGQLAPLGGEALLGAGVQIGYFAQAHESLNPRNNILDEILRAKPMTPAEARNYLGAFMFSGDDVFRPIETLSGGERGRVALAKLALEGANLLLLDEPTNHLDMDSQEILQDVLRAFDGTVILVSHDRYLVAELATQIWAVGMGEALEVFDGSYEEFVAARKQRQLEAQAAAKASASPEAQRKPAQASAKKNGLNPYQLQKRLSELEAHIAALEAKLATLHGQIETASSAGQAAEVHRLGAAYAAAEAELNATMDAWGELLA